MSGTGTFFIGCHRGCLDRRAAGATVVAIDVIRATTTAITAVESGRRCLLAATPEVARRRAAEAGGALLAGEVGGVKPPGFELQNSPSELAAAGSGAQPVVLVSTSGVPLMLAAVPVAPTWVASLRNAAATARRLPEAGRVAILGSDREGRLRREDALCAARVAGGLVDRGYAAEDAATESVLQRWGRAPDSAIRGGRSERYLRASGQLDDLDFVLAHVDDLDAGYVIGSGQEVRRA